MTREEIIKLARALCTDFKCESDTMVDFCNSIIRELEQEPKTGHWILSGGYWRCSECKEKALLKLDKAKGNCKEYMPIRSDYCPNCGAKMVEPQESEDKK